MFCDDAGREGFEAFGLPGPAERIARMPRRFDTRLRLAWTSTMELAPASTCMGPRGAAAAGLPTPIKATAARAVAATANNAFLMGLISVPHASSGARSNRRGPPSFHERSDALLGEQGRLVLGHQRVDQLVEGRTLQDLGQLVEGELDAVVGDAPLGEVVGADALGAIA